MVAAIVNAVAVVIGSLIGIVFRNKIKERYTKTIMAALALCTGGIGITSAIGTNDVLVVIICLVIGTIIGEFLKIDYRIESASEFFKRKLARNNNGETGKFSEGFISASLLFCVGSMAVMGSLEAGISKDYSIIFAKSAIDFVSAIAFSAAFGVGVAFSAVFVLVYQGLLTLFAGVIAPLLSAAVVAEMNAVGGTILIGLAINMLNLAPERIKIANMLPSIFLPMAYFPLYNLISGLIK